MALLLISSMESRFRKAGQPFFNRKSGKRWGKENFSCKRYIHYSTSNDRLYSEYNYRKQRSKSGEGTGIHRKCTSFLIKTAPPKETFIKPSQIPCGVLKLDLHLTFTKPLRTGLLITSFYWWGNWGLGSLHNPSKVTKLREADDDPTLRAKLTGRTSILSQLFKKFRNPSNPQSAFQSSLYHRRQWRWKCGGEKTLPYFTVSSG